MDKITSKHTPNNNHAMPPTKNKKKGKRIHEMLPKSKRLGSSSPLQDQSDKEKVGKRTWRGPLQDKVAKLREVIKGFRHYNWHVKNRVYSQEDLCNTCLQDQDGSFKWDPTLGNSHSEYHVGHLCMKYETVEKRWVLDSRSSLHWSHAICKVCLNPWAGLIHG